jgi:hypothetical protein
LLVQVVLQILMHHLLLQVAVEVQVLLAHSQQAEQVHLTLALHTLAEVLAVTRLHQPLVVLVVVVLVATVQTEPQELLTQVAVEVGQQMLQE